MSYDAVTTWAARKRHLSSHEGGGYTICELKSTRAGARTDRGGVITQAEIDVLPLCKKCERSYLNRQSS